MNVFIGGAWPYANGSLHIGHIAALLPGDILARYYRLKGDNVCYVSGSDCHGTPIQIRAKKENITPEEIASKYHKEFEECFNRLGFSYDKYGSTQDTYHMSYVRDFFLQLFNSGYVYKKMINQAYCTSCRQFLPDRFVVGLCPECGNSTKGDQCDICGSLLETDKLKSIQCDICGNKPIFKQTEHLYIALSRFQDFLTYYISTAKGWRDNAISLSQRYLSEGLKDRAITRDLEWGIDVPLPGFTGKKIYVWVEAVLGYLSVSKKWADESNKTWEDFWGHDSIHYYVHGKDNIPFHTIILPALLKAAGNLHLPDRIISSEYVTLEGRKISTSSNWAIWIPYLLKHYNPDSVRYFFTINGPEKRDTDFSWREFINSHNGELLGAFGNFVNRTLVFVKKYYDLQVPAGHCNPSVYKRLNELYDETGRYIEKSSFKEALGNIFSFIRYTNKYFDEERPWVTIKENREKCNSTIYTCIQIIVNLSLFLEPFLPFTCKKIRSALSLETTHWQFLKRQPGSKIKEPEILFERIDKERIGEEEKQLLFPLN